MERLSSYQRNTEENMKKHENTSLHSKNPTRSSLGINHEGFCLYLVPNVHYGLQGLSRRGPNG